MSFKGAREPGERKSLGGYCFLTSSVRENAPTGWKLSVKLEWAIHFYGKLL